MKVKDSTNIEKSETNFYCPECGKHIEKNEVICPFCETQLFD